MDEQALAEVWNGQVWRATAIAPVTGEARVDLTDVSCPSTSYCFVTGTSETSDFSESPLAETFDFTSWHRLPAPTADDHLAGLNLVSCTAASSCMLLGTDTVNESGYYPDAWTWNGSTYTARPLPPVANAALTALSCSSASFCMAVGSPDGARWDGSTWTTVTEQQGGGDPAAEPDAISCRAATDCIWVGRSDDGNESYAATWDGTKWSAVPPPARAQTSLYGVSCSSGQCTAVGDGVDPVGGSVQFLAESYDGHRWQPLVVPQAAVDDDSGLNAVSCPTTTFCMAVGSATHPSSNQVVPWTEEWDGARWTGLDGVTPPDDEAPVLASVSCASSTLCVAVGDDSLQQVHSPLVEIWDGSSWSVAAVPNLSSYNVYLSSVTCPTASYCLAIGGTGSAPLALTFDGSMWSQLPEPPVTTIGPVACRAAGSCLAAAAWDAGDGQTALGIVRLNGTTWSRGGLFADPGGGSFAVAVDGLSCAGGGCTVSGGYTDGSGTGRPLIEQSANWGRTWSVAVLPQVAGSLGGVSCASATSCTAVGATYDPGSSDRVPIAFTLTGGSWALATLPTAQAAYASYTVAASCVRARCTAVGTTNSGPGGTNLPLIEASVAARPAS